MPLPLKRNHLISVILLCVSFVGCASTRINVIDEKRNLTGYDKVFLIPIDPDPRNAVQRVRDEFAAYGVPAVVMDKRSNYKSSQGTAFFISKEGYLLTALHVMEETNFATVWYDGRRHYADVISTSSALDLAVLKLRDRPTTPIQPLAFHGDNTPSMGEKVYTIGYPLSSMLGSQPRLSEGIISATVGMKDNPDFFQVAAAIQPGNSGGPLLNSNGQVLGMIQQTINSARVMRESGAIPQNVNFALKETKILEFLKSTATPHFPIPSASPHSVPLNVAQKSIVKIQPGEVPPEDELAKILLVTCGYYAVWDIYEKFAGFELTFYDYMTRDPLFTSGQYNNILAFDSEGYTISQTVKKALAKIKGTAPKKIAAVAETKSK